MPPIVLNSEEQHRQLDLTSPLLALGEFDRLAVVVPEPGRVQESVNAWLSPTAQILCHESS